MKKLLQTVGLLLICLGLTACLEESQEVLGFQVYFTNEAGDQLVEKSYTPKAEGGEILVRELLNYLKKPESPFVSAIPDKVEVSRFTLSEAHLTLDFNSSYQEMDAVEEVLLRAAVVQTLVQVPEVEDVRFTVGGEALADVTGGEIGFMNQETFIDTKGEGINSYQYAALPLYLADASGQKLVREMRNVHYSSNNSLEKVVIEELIRGPLNENLTPVLPSDTRLLTASVRGSTCTLNFDKAFGQAPAGSNATAEAAIYAIVNSICEVCDVSRVEIQVDGSTGFVYRDQVSLDQKFKRNEELIETVAEEETSEPQSDVVDPAVGVESILNGTKQETEAGSET